MACPHIEYCPSSTGWCKSERQDYKDCVPFLISRCQNLSDMLSFKDSLIESLQLEVAEQKHQILQLRNERIAALTAIMNSYRTLGIYTPFSQFPL